MMATAAGLVLFLPVFFSFVFMDTPPDQLTCPSEWKDGKSEVLKCTIQVSGYTNQTCKQFSDLVDLQFTPRSSESPSSICTVRNLTQTCDGQYSSKGCRCKEEAQGAYFLEFVVEARKQFQEGGTWRCVPACVDEVLRNRYLHPPYAERLQCGPVSFDDLKPTPTTDTGKSVATTTSSGTNASHQTLGITSSKFGLYLSALVAIVVYVHT
ncbi:uncharacterized protein [Littorina saxatilis]|uniref:uncharacterized protein n=1 Tax=Littorina saxatilis TaxID=31220 RepID=UPI0038B482AD